MLKGALLAIVLFVSSFMLRNLCGMAVQGAFDGAFGIAVTKSVDVFAFVLPYVLYFAFEKSKSFKKDIHRKYPLWTLLFATVFAALVCSFAEGRLVGALGIVKAQSHLLSLNLWEMALSIAFSAVMVPVAEEFVFRKVTVGLFSRFGELPSWILSSALFASVHSLGMYSYAFVWGMFLSYLSRAYGMRYCIAFHILSNTVNIVLAVLQSHLGNSVTFAYIIITATMGIISFAVILKKHFSKRSSGNG